MSTCGKCRYWTSSDDITDRGEEGNQMECRRFPPVYAPQAGKDITNSWEWPLTFSDEGCGEFNLRKGNTK